jgi:hypothetical protein
VANDEIDEVAAISRPNWYVIAATLLVISILIAVVTARGTKGPVSDIRIRNATDRDLQDVVVGRGHYGPIGRGESSEYQSWGPAYRYAFVSLLADGKPMLLQPIDYFGETPLGPGRFTYILTFRHGSDGETLDIAFVKD